MSIEVSSLVKLRYLKKFNVLAGESGFDHEVSSVCLADFELDNNLIPYANGFRRGSFVIASMRENEALSRLKLIDIIKSLDEMNCVGLAFNEKMIKRPAKNVLDYCDKIGFPLLSFDPKDVYLENVIFDIMQAINKSNVSFNLDKEVKYMLEGMMSKDDVENLARTINPMFLKQCTVSYIWAEDDNKTFNPIKVVRNYNEKNGLYEIMPSVVPYRDGIVVIITMNSIEKNKRDATLNDIINSIDNGKRLRVVTSDEHSTFDELDEAFRECACAYLTANIEGKSRLTYEDIGVYKLILPRRNQPESIKFMNKYIGVMNREQLETAISYVRCDGDYDKISEDIICHRNTVRYRMNKLHEIIDPSISEFKFLENLSIAVKLYLASQIK